MKDTLTLAAAEALSTVLLRCVECAMSYPGIEAGWKPRYRCDCGGVLDVEIQLPVGAIPLRQLFDRRTATSVTWPLDAGTALHDHSGVWRYRELILPIPEQLIISRPEGNTSLYPVGIENCGAGRIGHRKIGHYAGLERLFLKHEGENPTGSFKDRGMTVGVTMASLLGAQAVACASTGNTSASLASYAAQAGMRAIVFLPSGKISAGKLAQTLAYGALCLQVRADFDAAMRLVREACDRLGIYLLNSINPFRIEGQKTIVWELLQDLSWNAPDWIVLPAGNLGNTSAFGKALREARTAGWIDRIPRLAAIQAAGANPFYRSFTEAFATRHRVTAETVASAIRIGDPVSYEKAVTAIRETRGLVAE